MHIKFYLIIPACFLVANCAAQSKFNEGQIKAKSDTFIVKRKEHSFGSKKANIIFVYSNKNKHKKAINYTGKELGISKYDINMDRNIVKRIFFEVLKDKINALHQREETVSGHLVFLPSEQLTDVGYVFAENTMITPLEIEIIDNRIRSEVKVNFTGVTYKTNPVINIPIGFAF